jgi:hypothetical protein
MNIQTELFESALCIEKPLYISNIEFNELSAVKKAFAILIILFR